jgi:hypothetical protein
MVEKGLHRVLQRARGGNPLPAQRRLPDASDVAAQGPAAAPKTWSHGNHRISALRRLPFLWPSPLSFPYSPPASRQACHGVMRPRPRGRCRTREPAATAIRGSLHRVGDSISLGAAEWSVECTNSAICERSRLDRIRKMACQRVCGRILGACFFQRRQCRRKKSQRRFLRQIPALRRRRDSGHAYRL